VKRIGDLLAGFFDEDTLKKAEGYNRLFSSWRAVAGESIASHSRIVELERTVLLVEADHPGWVQILQTRQKTLLLALRRRFPELTINGIVFRLSGARQPAPAAAPEPELPAAPESAAAPLPQEPLEEDPPEVRSIEDEAFRETLRRFQRTVKNSGRRRPRP
jgi:hypothetical protein